MDREKDTPKYVWPKRVCHFWWWRENYGFTGQPSTRLSKLTKLISAWFTSTRGVCVYYWQDWSLALSSLGLSVFFGQSQTTFFWRANESRLINIRTWEIEWLLSERHGLCVCVLSRHQSCRSSWQCHVSGQSVNWLSKTTKLLLLEYYYKR